MKKILLFDIDRTIFDTRKMSDRINRVHAEILGISLSQIEVTESEYINSLVKDNRFRTEDFAKFLSKKFNFKKSQLLADVLFDEKHNHIYDEIVFPEFYEVVEKLKNKFSFGIFSEGDLKLQHHKYNSMKIDKYIDPDLVFIFNEKDTLESLNKIPKNAIVVDDKERICEFLFKNGIKAIWLNKVDERVNSNFPTIHNLLDLPQVLY